MPVLFPSFVRDWGDRLFRVINDRGIRLGRFTESGAPTPRWPSRTTAAPSPAHQVRIDPGGQTVSAMDRLYLASSMPTLIIWGDRDDIIPVSPRLRRSPGHTREPAGGHRRRGPLPQIEAPEQFVEALVDFIDTTNPPTSVLRIADGCSEHAPRCRSYSFAESVGCTGTDGRMSRQCIEYPLRSCAENC